MWVTPLISRKLRLVACHPWSIFLSLRRHSTDIAQPFHVDLEVVGVCDVHIFLTPSQWSVKAAFISVVRQIHGAGGHLTIGDVVLIRCNSNRCAVTWKNTKTKHSFVYNYWAHEGASCKENKRISSRKIEIWIFQTELSPRYTFTFMFMSKRLWSCYKLVLLGLSRDFCFKLLFFSKSYLVTAFRSGGGGESFKTLVEP